MNPSNIVTENIINRRSIKPEMCNGKEIPEAVIWQILECANWAPTHGYTEPWRYVVYSGMGKHRFSEAHANMYKTHTDPDKFKQVGYDKIIARGKTTSHIIAIIMKRGANPKIPMWEEMCAVAASVQNMQLAAHSMGYAIYWNSGGMTNHEAMHHYFELSEEDRLLGFLYLGVTDLQHPAGRRISSIQDKVRWEK